MKPPVTTINVPPVRNSSRMCMFWLCSLLCTLGLGTAKYVKDVPFEHHPQQNKCEYITVPMCKQLPYNQTTMQNFMNHQNQEDAGLEIHQFFPLVKVRCSPQFKLFVCSLYVPSCTVLGERIPPCKQLCVAARTGCESLLNRFGLEWPESFECSQFPEDGLCISDDSTQIETTTNVEDPVLTQHVAQVTDAPLPDNSKCEVITVPLCANMPYTYTMMPNLLSHQSQDEAGLEVHQFYPLVQIRCSPYLQSFLCTLYLPVCNVLDEPIPPCRSLCILARTGCVEVLKRFSYMWPASLECSQFPENGLCIRADDLLKTK